MGLFDKARFLTESPRSDDYGKSRKDWQASKDAKKKAADKDKKKKGK